MSKAARKSRAVELRYMKWFRAKLVAVLPRQASMSPAMLIEIFFESCSKAHFKGRQCGFFAGGNLSCHKSPRLNFRSRHFEELFPGLPMWSPQEAIDWLFDRSIDQRRTRANCARVSRDRDGCFESIPHRSTRLGIGSLEASLLGNGSDRCAQEIIGSAALRSNGNAGRREPHKRDKFLALRGRDVDRSAVSGSLRPGRLNFAVRERHEALVGF